MKHTGAKPSFEFQSVYAFVFWLIFSTTNHFQCVWLEVLQYEKFPTEHRQHIVALMSIKSGPMLGSLEAETMHILRVVAAEARNPVFLYSVGKVSAVMLHIAMKAFYPAKPPFSFLHVDTTWKFREMIEFRDKRIVDLGLELIVHTNSEGLAKGVSPFTHGATRHTEIMKTEALLQALEVHEFDVALGGARRDEEISRAKERVFSFRTQNHLWEPKSQRPELWSLYNARKKPPRASVSFAFN